MLAVVADLAGPFGHLSVYGTQGVLHAGFSAIFYAFKAQLQAFISYLRTGQRGFDSRETVEQMKIVIAGIRSRAEGGRMVSLDEIEG